VLNLFSSDKGIMATCPKSSFALAVDVTFDQEFDTV
jgi:hypothetical protein